MGLKADEIPAFVEGVPATKLRCRLRTAIINPAPEDLREALNISGPVPLRGQEVFRLLSPGP
jgi:hypothetical protein